jgi:hypothetical protein
LNFNELHTVPLRACWTGDFRHKRAVMNNCCGAHHSQSCLTGVIAERRADTAGFTE